MPDVSKAIQIETYIILLYFFKFVRRCNKFSSLKQTKIFLMVQALES